MMIFLSENRKQLLAIFDVEGVLYDAEYLPILAEKINKEGYNYFLEEYYNKVHSKSSTAITNVPVKIHIVTDSDGSTNITESQILDEINEANSFLANSFLEITVCDETNYIADNNLYLFDISDDQGLLYSNNQSNILNIYFVESINDGDVAGYTYLPGNSSQLE